MESGVLIPRFPKGVQNRCSHNCHRLWLVLTQLSKQRMHLLFPDQLIQSPVSGCPVRVLERVALHNLLGLCNLSHLRPNTPNLVFYVCIRVKSITLGTLDVVAIVVSLASTCGTRVKSLPIDWLLLLAEVRKKQ